MSKVPVSTKPSTPSSLESAELIIPSQAKTLSNIIIPANVLPTRQKLTFNRDVYCYTQYRAKSQVTAWNHVRGEHLFIDLGCLYYVHKVWS